MVQTGSEKEVKECKDIKADAVLVAGGTEWVVLGLLNQGFNVRVLTRRFERAEELLGESGGNVDVFEADLNSDDTELERADSGVRAVVFIGNGNASWFGNGPPPPSAKILTDTVSQHAPDIQRFVMVSQVTHQEPSEAQLSGASSANIPYVVVKPGKLTDDESGLKSISISSSSSNNNYSNRTITRLNLAQVVCQAMVHDRSIRKLAENDLDNEGEFDFPSATIHVSNGDGAFEETNGTFWTDQFSNL